MDMEAADTAASSEADIATKSALNQASPGKSPLSAYLQKMEDMQREALETIYNVVDQPCRMMPTEEMDGFLMPFRQKLSFLDVIVEDHHDNPSPDYKSLGFIPSGSAYVVPIRCEYCGSDTTALCSLSCQRPKLFLQKQQPPFSH